MSEVSSTFSDRYRELRGLVKVGAAILFAVLVGVSASIQEHCWWAAAVYVLILVLSTYAVWTMIKLCYVAEYRLGRDEGSADALRDAQERHLAATRPVEFDIQPEEVPPGHGYLYAIKFSTGTVKVGQTRDLFRRMGEHLRDSAAYGVAIVDYWHSEPHPNYLDNEADLIHGCRALGNRAKREYFHGTDFDAVVTIAAELSRVPVTSPITGAQA